MRLDHDATLAYIARQLAFLQANMLKEQQKLEAVIGEKSAALENLRTENERLKKQNKKLMSKLSHDNDTPSSQESSPKSSFLSKSSEPRLPPPVSETLKENQEKVLPKASCGPKPPVPSRAGINRLLMQSNTSLVSPPPPLPPVRSTSLAVVNLERADSGRESDLTTSDVELHGGKKQTSSQDEGFCSSHEDSSGSSTGRQAKFINHRSVQKPSDIKLRSKATKLAAAAAAATTNLAVLEEDYPSSGNSANVTTVTYWTGSFL